MRSLETSASDPVARHGDVPRTRKRYNLAWAGIAAAVVYWGAESMVDAWVFGRGRLADTLLPRDPNELWMRTLAASLVMAFGLYARYVSVKLQRAAEHERAMKRDLDEALARLLADFIPICAGCKAIRDGGSWVRIEEYVTERTGSRFSHGLCPGCLAAAEAELES